MGSACTSLQKCTKEVIHDSPILMDAIADINLIKSDILSMKKEFTVNDVSNFIESIQTLVEDITRVKNDIDVLKTLVMQNTQSPAEPAVPAEPVIPAEFVSVKLSD